MIELVSFLIALSAAEVPMSVTNRLQDDPGREGAVQVVTVEEKDDLVVAHVTVPFLDIYGKQQEGLARLVVRKDLLDGDDPVPPFCHVHYEKPVDGAVPWAKRGWAVSTAVYDGKHPGDAAVANGNNLSRAILLWVRRLPFVDRTRLHIDGGSQGGYMALAMNAEVFPIAATTADMPVLNWSYNFAYFEANRHLTGNSADHSKNALPVLAIVTGLTDMATKHFGKDLKAEAYHRMSPIAFTDRMTGPIMVTSSTADILVPIEQVTEKGIRQHNADDFPAGYVRAFKDLAFCEASHRSLEECIPEADIAMHWLSPQEDTFELTPAMVADPSAMPEKKPKVLDRPWSPERQWNLVVFDEGPSTPSSAHTRYWWNTSPDTYAERFRKEGAAQDSLNAAKLDRLMQRYKGSLEGLPELERGKPAHRLQFPHWEQRDVVQALLDYASLGEEALAHMASLYEKGKRKPFGETLDLEVLEGKRKDWK